MIIIACECLIDQGFSLSKPLKNVQEFIPEFVPKTLLVPVMGKDSFSNKEFFFLRISILGKYYCMDFR